MLFNENTKLGQTYYRMREFCKIHKLELFGVFLLVVFLIAGIPWLMEHLVIRNNYKSVIGNSEWVGFLSSYLGGVIGGFITLGGVFLTLKFYRKQDKDKIRSEKKQQMTALYWFFQFKIEIVQSWFSSYEEMENETPAIPVGDLLTKDDFVFCFERLESVQEVFGQEPAEKMMNFYSELDSLQWVYRKLTRYNDNRDRYSQEQLLEAYEEFKDRVRVVNDLIETEYKQELEDIRKFTNDEPLG
ncbi:MAG: hypothetical protein J6M22_00040 [Firmicutes bacterium]|nr:hypothetical protein [Bacillota bacterium]